MPTYAYRCKNCEHEFETRQRITADALTECPECKGTLVRLLFPVGIVFKGSGFHVNDYPSSKSSTSGNGSKAEEKAESKPETKPESKETAAASKD